MAQDFYPLELLLPWCIWRWRGLPAGLQSWQAQNLLLTLTMQEIQSQIPPGVRKVSTVCASDSLKKTRQNLSTTGWRRFRIRNLESMKQAFPITAGSEHTAGATQNSSALLYLNCLLQMIKENRAPLVMTASTWYHFLIKSKGERKSWGLSTWGVVKDKCLNRRQNWVHIPHCQLLKRRLSLVGDQPSRVSRNREPLMK